MPDTLRTREPAAFESAVTLRLTFVIEHAHGLHARPASLLVKAISRLRCDVTAECGDEVADAKSLLSLLGLAVGAKTQITFTASGPDALKALEAIRHLFETRFSNMR